MFIRYPLRCVPDNCFRPANTYFWEDLAEPRPIPPAGLLAADYKVAFLES